MGLLNILGLVFGAIISLGSAYSIYSLINMIFTGAVEENWIAVVAGGILVYFFLGILAIIFLGGLFLMIISVAD